MLTNKLYVYTYAHGVGGKKNSGQGNIGLEPSNDEYVKITLGRTSKSTYSHHALTSAWATLSKAQAHELGMALLYLSNTKDLPCKGEGLTIGKHSVNMEVNLTFSTDLCTLLNKGEDVKKEVLALVKEKLDTVNIPVRKETLSNGT